MAQHQYDVVAPVDKVAVTASSGSSIGGSGVRVTIDDSNCTSKLDALKALEAIRQKIFEDTWPPAV